MCTAQTGPCKLLRGRREREREEAEKRRKDRRAKGKRGRKRGIYGSEIY